jgi:hypothetical protein
MPTTGSTAMQVLKANHRSGFPMSALTRFAAAICLRQRSSRGVPHAPPCRRYGHYPWGSAANILPVGTRPRQLLAELIVDQSLWLTHQTKMPRNIRKSRNQAIFGKYPRSYYGISSIFVSVRADLIRAERPREWRTTAQSRRARSPGSVDKTRARVRGFLPDVELDALCQWQFA